jgi:cysteine sulfinate desulfinase/cysteine desulfurase-like protein
LGQADEVMAADVETRTDTHNTPLGIHAKAWNLAVSGKKINAPLGAAVLVCRSRGTLSPVVTGRDSAFGRAGRVSGLVVVAR